MGLLAETPPRAEAQRARGAAGALRAALRRGRAGRGWPGARRTRAAAALQPWLSAYRLTARLNAALTHAQLTYEKFLLLVGLKDDHYSQTLCKIFDSDNSGLIGFREFVYNMAKFGNTTFAQEVAFAYRLYDLDGSGALDANECIVALREAMRSDLSQYGQRGALPKIDLAQKDSIRTLVSEVQQRRGTDEIRTAEFELMCARLPRIFLPAKFLFQYVSRMAGDATRLVTALPPDDLKARRFRCAPLLCGTC